MRTVAPGSVTGPEVLITPVGESGAEVAAKAERASQRLRVAAPLRLGLDPAADAAALRLLTEAISRQVPVEWELATEPPWPIRTLVHLPPPGEAADPAARRYADQWRGLHRFGLCTYRRGPGFIRIRDLRPGGPHSRVVVDGPWAERFEALAAATADITAAPFRPLLEELLGAGLAIRLGERYHVLPFRPRRWPVPFLDA
jgi:Family of unknown function (DUF5825)